MTLGGRFKLVDGVAVRNSISAEDINVEIGNSTTSLIDFQGAATSFSGIITNRSSSDDYPAEAIEFNEFYTLTLGQVLAYDSTLHLLYKGSTPSNELYEDGELIEAAEHITPYDELGYTTSNFGVAIALQSGEGGSVTDGDVIHQSQTDNIGSNTYYSFLTTIPGEYASNTLTNELIKFTNNGGVIEVQSPTFGSTDGIPRKPGNLTTEVYEGSLSANRYGKTNTTITIQAVGDTRTARNIDIEKTTPGGSVVSTGTAVAVGGTFTIGQFNVDFYGGADHFTSQASYYTFTGLSPDTLYTFRSRGRNAAFNGDYDDVQARTYKNTSISITEGADGGQGDGATGTETLDYLTITVTNSNGTHTPFSGETDKTFPYLRVNSTANVKYRQSTTTSFSGDFVTPSTADYGQALTLNGSGVVYIQPQLSTTSGFNTFNRTFEVIDGHISSSFQIGEQPGPPIITTDGTSVLEEDSDQTNGENYFTDVIEITISNTSESTINISYPVKGTGTSGNVRQVYYRVASNSSDKVTTFSAFNSSTYYGSNFSGAVDDDIPITSGKVYLQFYAQSSYRVATSEYSFGSTTVTLEATNGDTTATTQFIAGVTEGR